MHIIQYSYTSLIALYVALAKMWSLSPVADAISITFRWRPSSAFRNICYALHTAAVLAKCMPRHNVECIARHILSIYDIMAIVTWCSFPSCVLTSHIHCSRVHLRISVYIIGTMPKYQTLRVCVCVVFVNLLINVYRLYGLSSSRRLLAIRPFDVRSCRQSGGSD